MLLDKSNVYFNLKWANIHVYWQDPFNHCSSLTESHAVNNANEGKMQIHSP